MIILMSSFQILDLIAGIFLFGFVIVLICAGISVNRDAKMAAWRKKHNLRSKVTVGTTISDGNSFGLFMAVAQERAKKTLPRAKRRGMEFISRSDLDELGYTLSEILQASGCELILKDKTDKSWVVKMG